MWMTEAQQKKVKQVVMLKASLIALWSRSPNAARVDCIFDRMQFGLRIIWKSVCFFLAFAGIAFLRGFQVSLQALGGSSTACQLFLFHRNISLPTSHTEMVGRVALALIFTLLSVWYAVIRLLNRSLHAWIYTSEILTVRAQNNLKV